MTPRRRPARDESQNRALNCAMCKGRLSVFRHIRGEILILVSVIGVSYEEAATICNCVVGTVKSRLNRARANLLSDLGEQSARSAVEYRKVVSTEYFAGEQQGYSVLPCWFKTRFEPFGCFEQATRNAFFFNGG